MAQLRVFVSSTCYDLAHLRSQLHQYITALGHVPVLSEYGDILYDPSLHTHTSCVLEVDNADVMVVIVGGRWGGEGVAEAMSELDLTKVGRESGSDWLASSDLKLSVTQIEVLRAVSNGIPVWVLVDRRVWIEHGLYEQNKAIDRSKAPIVFPSIHKPGTEKYIFEFLNFLRQRSHNNVIEVFERAQEIETYLGRQWSALLQRLLSDRRKGQRETDTLRQVREVVEDLKSAFLLTLGDADADLKQAVSGALTWRRLIEFVVTLGLDAHLIADRVPPWPALLAKTTLTTVSFASQGGRLLQWGTVLYGPGGYIRAASLSESEILGFGCSYDDFSALAKATRVAIVAAVKEQDGAKRMFRLHDGVYDAPHAADTVKEFELAAIDWTIPF